jgi:hypothetical protein
MNFQGYNHNLVGERLKPRRLENYKHQKNDTVHVQIHAQVKLDRLSWKNSNAG